MKNASLESRRRFLGAGASGLGAIAFVRSPARAAQYEFKLGTVVAADHPEAIRIAQMFATIEKDSGGRIHTQVFPNSQLGNESAMFTQLRVGAMQFMIISPGFLASVIPAAEITNLGFIFKGEDEALHVMDGPLGEYVRGEINAKDLYAFHGMMDEGMYQIGSALHPIKSPDDLHGFKIRVVGRIAVDLFKELGANAVSMNLAEVYTGLQTHLIDGESAPLVVIETSRFFEVHKYVSLTNHAWVGQWLVANGDVWKSLPPDLQAIVERNHAAHLVGGRKEMKAENVAMVAKLRGQGIVINDVDQTPFRAPLANYYQTWAKSFGTTQWGILETAVGRKLG